MGQCRLQGRDMLPYPADDYWAATKNGTLSVETSSHASARLRGMFHATFMLRYKVHVACKFI